MTTTVGRALVSLTLTSIVDIDMPLGKMSRKLFEFVTGLGRANISVPYVPSKRRVVEQYEKRRRAEG